MFISMAFCAIGMGWLSDRITIKRNHAAWLESLKATHDYKLTITGTPDVRLAITIVTNPSTIERKTITVPFSQEFSAIRAVVWVESLSDGTSGKDGDSYDVVLTIDGQSRSHCRGLGHSRGGSRTQLKVGDF
jgi:hypothetical protein